jgi:predicted nucleic acid-binding Zn ribbon protein
VLGEMTRERGWDERIQAQRVFTDWAGIVGPEIAAHSHVDGFEDGIVSIVTDSTAWAKELKLLAARVVQRLNEEIGHGTVLRIEVRGPQAPSWKKGQRTIRNARGPRDTYG